MFKNRLPTRINNHTSETFSYKVFSNAIPNHWIIRDLNERDYGIDVLIEFVTEENEVTGKLAAIQLKYTQEISFNKNEWRHYNVKPSTTDYWLNSNIPTFIFFISGDRDVYFLSVDDYVRKNYKRYLENEKFYYAITPDDSFNVKRFLDKYQHVSKADVSDIAVTNLNYLHENFYHVFMRYYMRDGHMAVDDKERIDELNLLSYRLKALSKEVSIEWNVTSLTNIYKNNNYYMELCECHVSMFMDELDRQILSIIKDICLRIQPHLDYWYIKDPYFVEFLFGYKHSLFSDIRYESIHEGRGIPLEYSAFKKLSLR